MQALTEAIRLSHKLKNVPFMSQPIQQGNGHFIVLECVIMPFSLIVLLVEAILEAV